MNWVNGTEFGVLLGTTNSLLKGAYSAKNTNINKLIDKLGLLEGINQLNLMGKF